MCHDSLQKGQFSDVKPSQSHFWEPPSFFPSRQLLVRVVNHTLLLIQSVSRFYAQYQFSEIKPSHTRFWEPSSLSRQLLLCVVNHTLLLIRSVSRFYTKYQFTEVKPSQSHFWKPSSLFSAVTRARRKLHTTPNTECVTILYKKVSSVRSNPHTRTFEYTESFSEVSRARSKPHTTPDTECVTILYKMLVHGVSDKRTFENLQVFLGQILMCVVNHTLLLIRSVSRFSTNVSSVSYTLTNALQNHRLFLGIYSCAYETTHYFWYGVLQNVSSVS